MINKKPHPKPQPSAVETPVLILAYSGGLDTSFCIPFLLEKGYAIHAVSINTGGFSEAEVADMEKRAYQLGANHFECLDIRDEYYQKCIRYLVYGNILRGDTYPLSVSSERAFQAMAILQYVKQVGASYVAHGSTGAGNDQIRFDLVFKSLAPEVQIITPIRDHGFSRQEEMDFLQKKGFEWAGTKKDYSINQGIWGTSVGGKETLTSDVPLPEAAYPTPVQKKESESLTLSFEQGAIAAVNGRKGDPVALIREVESLAAPFGIGRDIHVGDTIIGIKGRVGFQAAAALLLIKAHQLLEKHTLTKWQAHWKKQLADWYGMQLHEGQYLDPTMRNVEAFLESTQQHVSGEVYLTLRPYTFSLDGISSPFDLMQAKFGKYGEENNAWSGEDAKGFTKILSNPHQIYYAVHPETL